MQVKHYQALTALFAFLLFINVVFNVIPQSRQDNFDKECKSIGLEYSKIDMLRGEFSCCKIHRVLDQNTKMAYQVEGCSSPFKIPSIKDDK